MASYIMAHTVPDRVLACTLVIDRLISGARATPVLPDSHPRRSSPLSGEGRGKSR
jgi:hypothetical protein